MFDTMMMDDVTALLWPHLPIHQRYLLDVVRIDPALSKDSKGIVSRGAIAQALNILLLADLMERTPTAADYVRDLETSGDLLVFDHGALRTIDLDGMGTLPSGRWAIARILEPIGYQESAVYPLDRLGITGFSYTHRDFPETLPQFFVSELHVSRFSPAFRDAMMRVTWESEDPLDANAKANLKRLQTAHSLPMREAIMLLPALVASFDRQHGDPLLQDYDLLLTESDEAAWIATEGNSVNHATNRVRDLRKVVAEQKLRGRMMKTRIEVSQSGRVQQTAYPNDPVQRRFIGDDGERTVRVVPGSFFKFIQRSAIIDENGHQRLDLRFDSGNAQGIFKMTAA